jgi:hypothetical protein
MRRIVWFKHTDVSEMCTTTIIMAMIEAVCLSETSVYFNQTTRIYIPEGCYLIYTFVDWLTLWYYSPKVNTANIKTRHLAWAREHASHLSFFLMFA